MRQRGVTVLELAVTLVIGGILLTLAVPNFIPLIQSNRITTATNDMIAAINLARAEALKRGVVVNVCRTDDPEAATPDCTRADNSRFEGNWSKGWLIYAVPPTALVTTGADYTDGTDTLVRRGDGFSAAVKITSDNDGNHHLSFNPDGTLLEADEVRYAICDDRGPTAGRMIRVPLVGRAEIVDTVDCVNP